MDRREAREDYTSPSYNRFGGRMVILLQRPGER